MSDPVSPVDHRPPLPPPNPLLGQTVDGNPARSLVDRTPLDLDAILARCEAATPGPWERGNHWHVQDARFCECLPQFGPLVLERRMDINGTQMLAHVHRRHDPLWDFGIMGPIGEDGHPVNVVIETTEYGVMAGADAEFIAASRSDIPSLVAEVERLRSDLADHHCDCLARKVAEVRADRDRLAEKDKKWFTDYVSLAESLADTENARRSLAARLQAVEALCDEAVFTIAIRMPDGFITYPKVVTVPKLRAALAVPAAEETDR